MPVKGSRTANNAISMAESILNKLDSVHGARAVFLELTNSESVRLHTALINSPECDRWAKTKGFHWVGTYSEGVRNAPLIKSQLVEDLNETMAMMR